ncbi:hypothetical protein [Georgenia thermotolerans]|uniref:Uncharacterized protein n=1 Tax=Georgenia thermotolerans TaxID=527326 RepID=A0A7J5UPB8_9MICO|nr:hypothetical protein [Georgenia thermotolerans]KAE8764081.1 hypothetical protein GB883_10870 [Georgenia thermotolerans]
MSIAPFPSPPRQGLSQGKGRRPARRRVPRVTRSTPLPAAMQVRDVLSSTLERDVTVEPTEEAVTPTTPAVTGLYVDDDFRAVAMVSIEASLAAQIAGALALLAPGRAAAAFDRAGALPADLLENIREVLNIMARALNVEGAPHVRLYTVYDSSGSFPPRDVTEWLQSYRPRLDLMVGVKGYGDGAMTVIVGA